MPSHFKNRQRSCSCHHTAVLNGTDMLPVSVVEGDGFKESLELNKMSDCHSSKPASQGVIDFVTGVTSAQFSPVQ